MHPFQFDRLMPGTLIHNNSESPNEFYVVTAHYGNRVTAVRAVDISKPEDWSIVHVRGLKDEMPPPPPNPPPSRLISEGVRIVKIVNDTGDNNVG